MSDFKRLADLKDPQEKFQKIFKIRNNGLKEPLDSNRRMQDVCEQIAPEFSENDGYYRGWYQRFTKNISRLKTTSKPVKKQKQWMPRRGSNDGKGQNSFFNQIPYFANVMV